MRYFEDVNLSRKSGTIKHTYEREMEFTLLFGLTG